MHRGLPWSWLGLAGLVLGSDGCSETCFTSTSSAPSGGDSLGSSSMNTSLEASGSARYDAHVFETRTSYKKIFKESCSHVIMHFYC